jgi:hypothetical protein
MYEGKMPTILLGGIIKGCGKRESGVYDSM